MSVTTCPTCIGTGVFRAFAAQSTVCPTCNGSGLVLGGVASTTQSETSAATGDSPNPDLIGAPGTEMPGNVAPSVGVTPTGH